MKHSGRLRPCLALTIAILSCCLVGCSDRVLGDMEREDAKRQVVAVTAARGGIEQVLRLTGTVVADSEVVVTSKIPGRVEEVFAAVGSQVVEGTILVELEREELALSVAQAEAAVATAKAGLARVVAGTREEEIAQAEAAAERAEAAADMSGLTFERMARLFAEESIPKTKHDEARVLNEVALADRKAAQARLDMARSGSTPEDIGIARAQVQQATAALTSVKRQYRNATIRSPISGVVSHRDVEPGEVIMPSMMSGTALLRIVDVGTLEVKVHISETRVTDVWVGQKAMIDLEGFPGRTFQGEVTKISPVVDAASRTFEVDILMEDSDARVKPGMFARVRLLLASQMHIITLPLDAVVEEEGKQMVFVVVDGVARGRQVTLGISNGIDVEVTTGVDLDEQVIIRGNVGLEDGEMVVLNTPQGLEQPTTGAVR